MHLFQKIFPNRAVFFLIFLLMLGAILVFLLVGKDSQRGALDDAALETMALTEARNYGLNGDPLATKSVRMRLDEWNQIVGGDYGESAAELGLPSDLPVFVFVIRGEIIWKGPSGKAWQGGESERFDNITIVLNANTGEIIYVGSMRAGFPLPVSIP